MIAFLVVINTELVLVSALFYFIIVVAHCDTATPVTPRAIGIVDG